LCDVPAVYRDGGESLWRIFLVFRWGSSNFVSQSLVANFQYPCSDLRDWVRTRMRGSDTRFRFSQAAAGTAAVGKAVRRNVRPPSGSKLRSLQVKTTICWCLPAPSARRSSQLDATAPDKKKPRRWKHEQSLLAAIKVVSFTSTRVWPSSLGKYID